MGNLNTLSRQLTSSQVIGTVAAIDRQIASSQIIETMAAVSRQIASSRVIETMAAIDRQIASSQIIETMAAVSRQIASSRVIEATLNQQLASISISTSRIPSASVQTLIKSPKAVSTATNTRERSGVRSRSNANDLEVGRPTSWYDISGRLRLFDELITDRGLRQVSRRPFGDGYYTYAVEQAFKYLNNMVKAKSGLNNKDGAKLMRAAFSAATPVLMLNAFQSESDRNEQLGYVEIFAGVMTGIRNPRAHEPDLFDNPEVALELLVIANHLMRRVIDSTVSWP